MQKLSDVKEAAAVHVHVRQNLGVRRCQTTSEVWNTALSMVVEVLALQTFRQRWPDCLASPLVKISAVLPFTAMEKWWPSTFPIWDVFQFKKQKEKLFTSIGTTAQEA